MAQREHTTRELPRPTTAADRDFILALIDRALLVLMLLVFLACFVMTVWLMRSMWLDFACTASFGEVCVVDAWWPMR